MSDSYKLGSGPVLLPVGYQNEDGLHREVDIDTIKIIDKKNLTKPKNTNKPNAVISDILSRCILEIKGGMARKSDPFLLAPPRIARNLFQQDRDYLLGRILIDSDRGVLENYPFNCTECDASLTEKVDLSDVDVFPLEEGGDTFMMHDLRFPIKISKKVGDQQSTQEYTKVKIDFFTGETLEKIDGKTDGLYDSMTKLLAMKGTFIGKDGNGSIVEIKLDSGTLERYMNEKDLDDIYYEMGQVFPGPDLIHETTCPECGEELEVAIELGQFFQPEQAGKKKTRRKSKKRN